MRVILVLSLVIFLLLGTLLFTGKQDSVEVNTTVTSSPIETETILAVQVPLSDQPAEKTEADVRCLTEQQFLNDSIFLSEKQRFDPIRVDGSVMEPYTKLEDIELEGLIAQGDSAAMAMLGARMILLAYDKDPDLALGFLSDEVFLRSKSVASDLTQTNQRRLENAQNLFYSAALHGRVAAIFKYGQALRRGGGNPVSWGWLSQEEYDALDQNQKIGLSPEWLYIVSMFDILPELATGPLRDIQDEMDIESDLVIRITNQLTNKFLNDLAERGLPQPVISASSYPDNETLKGILCKDDFDRLEHQLQDMML